MRKFFLVLSGLCCSSTLSFAQTNDHAVPGDAKAPVANTSPASDTQTTKAPMVSMASGPEPDAIALRMEGTKAKISLLTEVTSKLEDGSPFQARLDEPILKDGQTLLPEGTV